jgi:hypothetical protein
VVAEYGDRGNVGYVSVLTLGDGELSNRMVEVEHGDEVTAVRLVPLADGRVVLVTGDGADFFDLAVDREERADDVGEVGSSERSDCGTMSLQGVVTRRSRGWGRCTARCGGLDKLDQRRCFADVILQTCAATSVRSTTSSPRRPMTR